MSDTPQAPVDSRTSAGSGGPATQTPVFGTAPDERPTYPVAAWSVAALVVLVVVGVLVFAGRKNAPPAPNALLPPDPYASSLQLSQFVMSESANLSGGKLTYLDGHVRNAGSKTLTGATVQVVFLNDEALPPQIDTLPLTLIRMKEPYIDTESVGGDPIKPGEERDFRLIFESVPENWNTQMPEVRVVHTELR